MDSKYIFPKILLFGVIVLGALLFNSCDDSFLYADPPSQFLTTDTIFVTNQTQPFQLNFDFNKTGECTWRLYQFPKWLEVSPKEGVKYENSNVNLQFSIDQNAFTFDFGFYTFPLVFYIDDTEMVAYTIVMANLGNPTMEITPSNFVIENSLTGNFEIVNRGNGILFWEVTDSPSWISIETEFGMLEQNHGISINFSVDITGLEPGDYEGVVKILNNASNNYYNLSFHLKVKAHGYYGVYNKGEFIDSKFNRKNDQVIILTKNPNRLLFFNSGETEPSVIELDRVPQCLALSEDEETLAVGYSNTEISTYSTESKNLLSTYTVQGIPLSVEFGTKGWLYYIARSTYQNHFYSLNLTNGEIKKSTDGHSGLKTLIRVPGKNMLVSTQPGYSPDGLFIFDITYPGATDSLNQYHLDMMGYWISDDGNRLFTGTKTIYRVPEYIPEGDYFPNQPQVEGELELNYTQVVDCIAQQTSSGRIFVATGFGYTGDKTQITLFNHQTLVKQKSYELTFERPQDFPMGNTWWGKPVAMYPSPNETELWLVQTFPGKTYNDPEIWSVVKVVLD
jgi:hypothetical protein